MNPGLRNPYNGSGGNSNQLMEAVSSYGGQLCESRTWKPMVEDIQDDFLRRSTAIMLENTRNYIESLDETTKAISIKSSAFIQ